MTPGRGHLEIDAGDGKPTRLLLDGSVIRIGRSRDAELHVPDQHVSKRHAEIRPEDDGFVIVDVGSLAGVFVNGTKTERHKLAPRDTIQLGTTPGVRITFHPATKKVAETASFVATVSRDGGDGLGRLARFFEFSQKLGGGFSLEEVLQDVVDLALDVTRAERGLLALRRDDGSLDLRVARGAGGIKLPVTGLRISDTLVQKTLSTGAPSIIADVNLDADLAMAASIVSLELRSAVTLPLARFEAQRGHDTGAMTTFGLIYLDSRRQHGGLEAFDLGILGRLARDASTVIETARQLREEEERRRIEQEVRMAREVQAALMPEQFRSTPTYEIAGVCVPCHELGGDYVDQFELGDGRMAVVVADVCGKGIAASLLAATLQGALAAEILRGTSLGEAVARVNRVHCRLAPVGKFITMAVVVLAPNGTAAIVNAGHCPILHQNARGGTLLPNAGMALGLDEEASYQESTVQLQPGDSLVLYTDGIVECLGPGNALFDDARLLASVNTHRHAAAPGLLAALVRDLDAFRGDTPTSDDMSVIVVRRR